MPLTALYGTRLIQVRIKMTKYFPTWREKRRPFYFAGPYDVNLKVLAALLLCTGPLAAHIHSRALWHIVFQVPLAEYVPGTSIGLAGRSVAHPCSRYL